MNKYTIKLVLLLGLLLSGIVFYKSLLSQKEQIFLNAKNTQQTLETYVQNTINSVKMLNQVAHTTLRSLKINHLDTPLPLEFNDLNKTFALQKNYLNSYPLDLRVNIAGYGTLEDNIETRQEMQMSLALAPYFKMIHEQGKRYVWVYYYSNKNFLTLYPFVNSKIFTLDQELKKQPIFQYATPQLNPQRKIFVTPLYEDTVGKGLMVTVGKPVYDKDKFLGITEIDITLKSVNTLLKKMDVLSHTSILINKQHEILGYNNLDSIEETKIRKVTDFLPMSLITSHTTDTELHLHDYKYIYKQKFSNSSLEFIYYANALSLWAQAFLATLPLLLLLFLFYYIVNLYLTSKNLNTKLLNSEQKLKFQANHDFMTGAYNRRYFFESANSIFLKNSRKNNSIAVVMLDIDNFKKVNDTYGHDVGDLVIIDTVNILKKNLRTSDLLARFGGEEFCILLEDITEDDVVNLFEKIRMTYEKNSINVNNLTINYTISFGISYGTFYSLEEAINLSDKALYISKNAGKNTITLEKNSKS